MCGRRKSQYKTKMSEATKKARFTIEISVRDWTYVDPTTVLNLDQDLMHGGALVVTARGVEVFGIVSAKVVDVISLEKVENQS